MRDYGIISPQFWTGTTGKQIKERGHLCQVIALYLMTCPSANMIGFYYLPLPILCHETGSPLEGAMEALLGLSDLGFAHYDVPSEHVWVVEMASWQIGKQLKQGDKRITAIKREITALSKIPFYNAFLKRYKKAFYLNNIKGHLSPSEAPPKPLRSQEQEQEQDQDQKKINDSSEVPEIPSEPIPIPTQGDLRHPSKRMILNYETGKFEGLQSDDFEYLEEHYPACEIKAEFLEFEGYWFGQGTKKKKKNWWTALINRLSSVQQRGGTKPRGGAPERRRYGARE